MVTRSRLAGGAASGHTFAVTSALGIAKRIAGQASSALLDALYPARCVGCHRHGTPLCGDCLASQVPATGDGRCGNCSAEWLHSDAFCPLCTRWRSLDGAVAAFAHAGAAREAVLALKYRRQTVIAPDMAEAIASTLDGREFDLAAPIPLHPSRRKRRGFNQAERIARNLDIPLLPGGLRRVRKTKSQVGLGPAERDRNVAGAFSYEGPELDGLRIALVDDVVTTGATASECATVLKDFGAASVVAVSFTRMSYRPGLAAITD